MKSVMELAELIESRKGGMSYGTDEEAILSIIASECRFSLKTQAFHGWEKKHDDLAETIIQLTGLLAGRFDAMTKRPQENE